MLLGRTSLLGLTACQGAVGRHRTLDSWFSIPYNVPEHWKTGDVKQDFFYKKLEAHLIKSLTTFPLSPHLSGYSFMWVFVMLRTKFFTWLRHYRIRNPLLPSLLLCRILKSFMDKPRGWNITLMTAACSSHWLQRIVSSFIRIESDPECTRLVPQS